MNELERAARELVTNPPRPAPPVEEVAATAARLRRRRRAQGVALVIGAVALVVAVALTVRPGDGTVDVVVDDPRTPGRRPPGPTVVVEPAEGLSDGQYVRIRFRGFTAGADVRVAQCAAGATLQNSSERCDLNQLLGGRADDQGSGTANLRVARVIRTTEGLVDCAERPGRCVVGAGELASGDSATAPLAFRPAPLPPEPATLAASPADGLVDGQPVEVTGSGFEPGEDVSLVECIGQQQDLRCSTFAHVVVADRQGRIRTTLLLDRNIFLASAGRVQTTADCAGASGCSLRAVTELEQTAVPITFDTNLPPPPPPVVEVQPSGPLPGDEDVSISGRGFPRRHGISLTQCTVGPTGALELTCASVAGGDAVTDDNGSFRTRLPVRRFVGATDCAERPGRCVVVGLRGDPVNEGPFLRVDLTFRR